MTEKRFTAGGFSFVVKDNGKGLNREELINLLNELNNENEQLKERIKTLEREVQELSCGEADWLIEEML